MSFSKLLISTFSISLCLWLLPKISVASLPKQALIPGGIAFVRFTSKYSHTPHVSYLGNRVLVLPDKNKKNHWLAIVGIPLDAKLGTNYVQINVGKNIINKSFVVKDKKYPVQRLTIADKNKVEPSATDQEKIAIEYTETIQTYAIWHDKRLASLKLALPVKGRISSPFGLARVINNIPKNPHSGLDIAAPLGTAVHAAKEGKVINIGNYFYTGNIVFIDHGQGFITSYCHLDKVSVKIGDVVKTRDIIGMVGKTGRATGPHLHWSVSLNGIRVNPRLFVYG